MSEGTDRGIRSNRLLFGVVIIVLIAVAAGAGFSLWLRQSRMEGPQQPAAQDRHPIFGVGVARGDEPLIVTLYCPLDGTLALHSATVKRRSDTQLQAREAIFALLADPCATQNAVLRDVRLRAFYVDASGAAYVDLSPIQQKDVRASVSEELLALYALVDTVVMNFEEIKQVRILVDGKEAQTLAGHMDLSRMYTKRTDLVKQ